MFRPIRIVLDRLAERCVAVAVGMLETTLKSLHIAHAAECQHELEELARTYEAEGLTQIANLLRERAGGLMADSPAAFSEVLLNELAAIGQSLGSADSSRSLGETQSTPASPLPRRLKKPAKLANSKGATLETPPASPASFPTSPSPAAADNELYFPLTQDAPSPRKEDQPE